MAHSFLELDKVVVHVIRYAGESGLISNGVESLIGFHELWQEPGVYSRVTAGMSIRNSSLFIEVRNLSRYEGQLRNVN